MFPLASADLVPAHTLPRLVQQSLPHVARPVCTRVTGSDRLISQQRVCCSQVTSRRPACFGPHPRAAEWTLIEKGTLGSVWGLGGPNQVTMGSVDDIVWPRGEVTVPTRGCTSRRRRTRRRCPGPCPSAPRRRTHDTYPSSHAKARTATRIWFISVLDSKVRLS